MKLYAFLGMIGYFISSTVIAGGMPPGGGPPPEALTACEHQTQNSSCSFQSPHGSISGQCLMTSDSRMACVPNGMGMGRKPQGARVSTQLPNKPPMSRTAIGGNNPLAQPVNSRVPDTGQGDCFNNEMKIECPSPGEAFYGQDAQYSGAITQYQVNEDKTVKDLVTGLLWEQSHHEKRMSYYAAQKECENLELAGQNDWRLPTIKELYSIIDFRGGVGIRPYLDDAFEISPPSSLDNNDQFASTHSPEMMGQTWSSTIYTGVHYGRPGVEAAFFVNFLDGRIKQAPTQGNMALFYRCVSGTEWGQNQFVEHVETVQDKATGLIWQQSDDGKTRNWAEALAYCEDLNLAGKDDWRLPNAKELETIVDYTQHSPAIDQRFFHVSNSKGWYWTSTTHGDNIRQAAYVCFGPCTSVDDVDVHGAGAQRSDPKAGQAESFGPMGGQRDAVRINNLVRCVR